MNSEFPKNDGLKQGAEKLRTVNGTLHFGTMGEIYLPVECEVDEANRVTRILKDISSQNIIVSEEAMQKIFEPFAYRYFAPEFNGWVSDGESGDDWPGSVQFDAKLLNDAITNGDIEMTLDETNDNALNLVLRS